MPSWTPSPPPRSISSLPTRLTNLQLNQELYRPKPTRVAGVDDEWDQFDSFQANDEIFPTLAGACLRVLKPGGAIWVIGTYHNIFRLGAIMQDLGCWFLNDVVWIKI